MLLKKLIAIGLMTTSLLQGGLDAAMPDKDIEGTLFLANAGRELSSDYVPTTEKLGLSGQSATMRKDAAQALRTMFEAAKADGIKLLTVSGYRSYSKQKIIFNRKVKSTGSKAKANLLVALPGTSEHQLGMAMDLGQKGSTGLTSSFGSTKAGKWVAANAHLYGFIVRYQKGWEEITGYSFEPWHVRYIGVEHAKLIHEMNIPLETYLSAYRVQTAEMLITSMSSEVLP